MNTTPVNTTPVISVRGLRKDFPGPSGGVLTVLDDVTFDLYEGQVVALLGKSGSGKSTLLRHVAGLLAPSGGTVHYRGEPVTGPNRGTAMLFQSFALMPWLTVQQNVELGLQARGVHAVERRGRALRAIDMVGLDGFENAYPKELSGGMRQRVGFARALVVEPDVLLMDEPFSALDVLTAQTLRNELLELLAHPDSPTRTVLLVTHSIEEAVQLADRILVLDTHPGRIKADLRVALPQPRDRRDDGFQALVEDAYEALTGQRTAPAAGPGQDPLRAAEPLPTATVEALTGLLEVLDTRGGAVELAALADALAYEVDDLMPVVEAAQLLGYARVADNRLYLTVTGRGFARADILPRKHLFAAAALANVPLIATIRTLLLASDSGRLREPYLIGRLCGNASERAAHRQLATAVTWGRYAELYEYDADDRVLLLPAEHRRHAA
ncbi:MULTISPECIES: ABC transporter ATP-binding protein [Streptomyces]|uniref:Nitrate/sulfonate/bicarbonate ABC transporter ATP-binding protein n=3 Tax=Streptomyces rimosus TaxID=1927 RepID=L8F2V6_STRR1|nr:MULTISPECIES: nitrate/sulfonate/bicarbonate ABC transporter ATP-binding protein [Streptomyces]KOG70363.1 nitrate ABC transporter ATP-binding protein [Kitasatospora aureofaciens]MYT41971.1 ATP-binding cassette domain-containing protein [Streptomyces sp. SID5471]KOT33433.1 nitrate ABC transporter ATP-binding protein [Streptomyces rimosus subsp. rimosus]KOT41533.1 nitrate ABC transporter ATP-binding protein [Streptomyces sp. NRRL WC-3701]KOT53993.1 nitrate ABC transporter ATP-binding protein [